MSCLSVNSFEFSLEKLRSRCDALAFFSRKSNELADQQGIFYDTPAIIEAQQTKG